MHLLYARLSPQSEGVNESEWGKSMKKRLLWTVWMGFAIGGALLLGSCSLLGSGSLSGNSTGTTTYPANTVVVSQDVTTPTEWKDAMACDVFARSNLATLDFTNFSRSL